MLNTKFGDSSKTKKHLLANPLVYRWPVKHQQKETLRLYDVKSRWFTNKKKTPTRQPFNQRGSVIYQQKENVNYCAFVCDLIHFLTKEKVCTVIMSWRGGLIGVQANNCNLSQLSYFCLSFFSPFPFSSNSTSHHWSMHSRNAHKIKLQREQSRKVPSKDTLFSGGWLFSRRLWQVSKNTRSSHLPLLVLLHCWSNINSFPKKSSPSIQFCARTKGLMEKVMQIFSVRKECKWIF